MNSVYKKIESNNVYRWLEKNLYLVLFCIWYSAVYISSVNIARDSLYYTDICPLVIRLMKYLMFLYIILFRKFSLKQWIAAGTVLVLLYYTGRNAGDQSLLVCWLFILGCGEENVDRVVKSVAWMLGIYLSVTTVLALTGVLENVVLGRGETTIRYALGFRHPNSLGFELYILTLCLLYLASSRRSAVISFCVAGALAVFVWIVPNSRTAVLGILMAAVLFFIGFVLNNRFDRAKKGIMYSLTIAAAAVNVFTVIMSMFYSGTGLSAIFNSLLSGRPGFGKAAFNEFGVSLFGQQVYFSDIERQLAGLSGELILDCAYVNMLLRSGLVTYLIISGSYIAAMYISAKNNKFRTVSVLFLMALYAVSERVTFMATSNIFIVLLSCLFFYNSNEQREKQKTVCGHIAFLMRI